MGHRASVTDAGVPELEIRGAALRTRGSRESRRSNVLTGRLPGVCGGTTAGIRRERTWRASRWSGQSSQSERDWAYALRALERGESPGSIEDRIERFRQDKPNPRYYAHRTVSRAVMAHARSSSPPSATAAGSNSLEPNGLER